MRLDDLAKQSLRLIELSYLQIRGAQEERELGVLRVSCPRRFKCLYCFLKLAIGHEGLCEQTLQPSILLMATREPGEPIDCIDGTTRSQVYDGQRLQCGIGFDDGAGGAIESVTRVSHLRSCHVKVTEHHPRIEERGSIQALGLLQLAFAQARFGRINDASELDERIRRGFGTSAPICARLIPHPLLRLCLHQRRRGDHRRDDHAV